VHIRTVCRMVTVPCTIHPLHYVCTIRCYLHLLYQCRHVLCMGCARYRPFPIPQSGAGWMNPASPCPGCATPGGPCQRSAWQPHCPVSPLPWRLLQPLPLAQQAHTTQSRVHTVTRESLQSVACKTVSKQLPQQGLTQSYQFYECKFLLHHL